MDQPVSLNEAEQSSSDLNPDTPVSQVSLDTILDELCDEEEAAIETVQSVQGDESYSKMDPIHTPNRVKTYYRAAKKGTHVPGSTRSSVTSNASKSSRSTEKAKKSTHIKKGKEKKKDNSQSQIILNLPKQPVVNGPSSTVPNPDVPSESAEVKRKSATRKLLNVSKSLTHISDSDNTENEKPTTKPKPNLPDRNLSNVSKPVETSSDDSDSVSIALSKTKAVSLKQKKITRYHDSDDSISTSSNDEPTPKGRIAEQKKAYEPETDSDSSDNRLR